MRSLWAFPKDNLYRYGTGFSDDKKVSLRVIGDHTVVELDTFVAHLFWSASRLSVVLPYEHFYAVVGDFQVRAIIMPEFFQVLADKSRVGLNAVVY